MRRSLHDTGALFSSGPQRRERVRSSPLPDATVLDATGCAVVPGFVDAHTHVVYAGDRRDELRQRLAGATYQEHRAAGRRDPRDRACHAERDRRSLVEATAPRLRGDAPLRHDDRARSRADTA